MNMRRDDAHHERPVRRGRMLMAPYGLKSQYCRTQSAKATNLLSDGGVAAARLAASPHVLVIARILPPLALHMGPPVYGGINTTHLIIYPIAGVIFFVLLTYESLYASATTRRLSSVHCALL